MLDFLSKLKCENSRPNIFSTYGVVFTGTPHLGGNGVLLGRLMMNVASVFIKTDD